MGRGGRGRGFGGKRKAGGRGGGKGRGKNKKRRRGSWNSETEDSDGSEAKAVNEGKGSNKSKGKGSKRRPDSDAVENDSLAVEEKPQAAKRPVRPGFDSLLQSFGIADSDVGESDDDDDEEDEEDDDDGDASQGEEPEEEDAEAAADDKISDSATVRNSEDAEVNDAETDDEDEMDDADGVGSDGADEGKGRSAGPGDANTSGLDFYPNFWDDPPSSLSLGEQQSTASTSGAVLNQQFSIPGLARCESRDRDIAALLRQLKSSSDAAGSWRKCKLAPGVQQLFDDFISKEKMEIGPREGAFFLFLHAYLDVAFPQHTHLNSRVVRALSVLHVVDHVLKVCHEVFAHTAAINKGKKSGTISSTDEMDVTFADKGFTRARVLILCPFRSVCYELVRMFLAFCPNAKQVANRSRFEEEFGDEDDTVADDKPADWSDLFSGNTDDCFRLGLAVSRKAVRLYTPFENSDVLICSPLGLRQITGAEGEKQREFDFLSSVEVCIIDRADVMRMQNWDHVREVLQVVNRRPQALQGIDISRLRPAFADGKARAFRQTVISAAGQFIDSDALFKAGSSGAAPKTALDNLAKKLRAGGKRKRGRGEDGAVGDELEDDQEEEVPMSLLASTEGGAHGMVGCRGLVRLTDPPEGAPLQRTTALGIGKQFFLHVACESLLKQPDQLFDAFEKRYWKPLGSSLDRLLIVAPSYFSFLRLRRFFREEGTSFCSAFEYSKNRELSRSRFQFFHGERRVLLVTERFLWYRRYRLKGADYVYFFGPPEVPEIFEEVLSNVRTPSQCNSMCFFTRYDAFAMERIVGHERARRMLTSPPGKVFVYS